VTSPRQEAPVGAPAHARLPWSCAQDGDHEADFGPRAAPGLCGDEASGLACEFAKAIKRAKRLAHFWVPVLTRIAHATAAASPEAGDAAFPQPLVVNTQGACLEVLRLCLRKRVATVHIYKAAGTTILVRMRSHCRHQRAENPCSSARVTPESLAGWVAMFSVTRDPVARFKSAVGEIMRRRTKVEIDPTGRLTPTETLRAALDRLWRERVAFDWHLVPHAQFLGMRQRPLPLTFLGDAAALPATMAYMHAVLGGNVSMDTSQVARVTKDQDQRTAQMRSADLSPEDTVRVCELYWPDYVILGHPLPEPCEHEALQPGTRLQLLLNATCYKGHTV